VPRYDYRCEDGHKYEVVESFGSPSVHPCQRCGKEARRQLVAPPLVFKGKGFYKTSGRSSDFGTTGFDSSDSSNKDSVPTTSNRSKSPPKKAESASSE
jgi:putative FmdB family regulatory protein